MTTIEISAAQICARTLNLGIRGENARTEVCFDFSAWAEEFDAPGAVELYVRRYGETTAYPVVLAIDGSEAVWTVSAIDTHNVGLGEAEFVYLIDSTVVKSVVFGTVVQPDIGRPASDPPEPYESWMEELGEMAAGTLINAQRAEAAQTAAETAQGKAEAAQTAAERAQELAETAKSYADADAANAYAYASNAYDYAQTASSAKTAAEYAQGQAEAARATASNYAGVAIDKATVASNSATAAGNAKTAAQTAQGKAEAAQTAAETAQGKAEAAQTAAELAQGFAEQAKDSALGAAASADLDSGHAYEYMQTASSSATAASGSAAAAAADALKAEGWAVGKQNGVDVGSGSPYYHTNAQYSADQAAGSATAAGESATAAAASAAAAETSVMGGNFAGTYSTSATYAVGDYVLYNSQLYRCTTAISTAEAWTAAHWTAVKVGTELTVLKSALVTPTETGTTASQDYAIGDYFWHDGALYRARYNITTGDTIDYGTDAEICGAADEIARLYKTEDTTVNALHNLVNYWYDTPADKESSSTFIGRIVRNGTRILLNGSCPSNSTTAKLVVTTPGIQILVGSPASVVKKFPIPMIDGHTYRARLHVISGTATQRVYPLFHKTTAINAVGDDSVDPLTGDEIRDITFNSADYPDGVALSVSILRKNSGNVLTNFLFDLTVEDITDGAAGQEYTNIAPTELEIATATHAVGDLLVYKRQLYEVTAAIAVGETLIPGTNIVTTTVDSELASVKDKVSDFVVTPSVYVTQRAYLQNGTMSNSTRAVEIENGVINYKSFSTYNRGFVIADAIYPISGVLSSHVFTLNEIAPINRLANANTLTTFNNYSSDSSAAYYVLRVYFFAVDENDTVTKVGDFTAPLGNGLHKTQFTVPESATHYALIVFTPDNGNFSVTIVPEFSIT